VRHALAAWLMVVVLGVASAATSGASEFQVVVHPSVKGTWISRANLHALFTRKVERWGDKTSAKPVDQSAQTAARRAFASAVFGLSLGEVQRYWQDRVAAERVFPPPIKASDEEVLDYVASTEGAVGYVGPDTAIPAGVRVIAVTE